MNLLEIEQPVGVISAVRLHPFVHIRIKSSNARIGFVGYGDFIRSSFEFSFYFYFPLYSFSLSSFQGNCIVEMHSQIDIHCKTDIHRQTDIYREKEILFTIDDIFETNFE